MTLETGICQQTGQPFETVEQDGGEVRLVSCSECGEILLEEVA